MTCIDLPKCFVLQIVILMSTSVCVTMSSSISDDYYILYRQLAILRHQNTMRHRSHILLPSEVNATLISDKSTWISKYSVPCPNVTSILTDDNPGIFDICPSYTVPDYDIYRNPMIMFQVKCRCEKCMVWFKSDVKMCEPLFEMKIVERVVKITEQGEQVYAQVWEPISYACACRRKPGRRRHVMPP